MSSDDQMHSARLHGEALLAAQDESFQPLLDHLAASAEGRDDLRAKVAGDLAGAWFAKMDGQLGHELIAAGLLIVAGATDLDEVTERVRAACERGRGSVEGYGPSG